MNLKGRVVFQSDSRRIDQNFKRKYDWTFNWTISSFLRTNDGFYPVVPNIVIVMLKCTLYWVFFTFTVSMVTLNSKAEENLFLNSSHYIVTLTNDALWVKLYNTYCLSNTNCFERHLHSSIKNSFRFGSASLPHKQCVSGFYTEPWWK